MQQNKAQKVIEEVKKAFIGKTECVEKLMTAILAGGHVLVEDVPGVGKTTLALAFASNECGSEQSAVYTGCFTGRYYRLYRI